MTDRIKSALNRTRQALNQLRAIPDLKTIDQSVAWGASNFLEQAEDLLAKALPGSALRPSDGEWSAARDRVINTAKRVFCDCPMDRMSVLADAVLALRAIEDRMRQPHD
jgi:hypothetical protein